MCRAPGKRLSRSDAPFPWRAVSVLGLGGMTHFYGICSLFSYAGFLCVDLGWSRTVDEAGFLAGWLGTALVVGRLFTAVFWGKYADRRGRKAALLWTFGFNMVGNLAFGLCRDLRLALAVRVLLLGAGSGWVSVSGLYAGEVAGPERQNRVNSVLLSGGTLTQLLAPAVAAVLYGTIPRYPALAPSLLGAGIACVNLVLGAAWLEETLDVDARAEPAYDRVVLDADAVDAAPPPPAPPATALSSRPFLAVVSLKLALGFVLFASFDVIPLWAIASGEAGGLALSRGELAAALTAGATLQMAFTSTIMTPIMNALGHQGSLYAGTSVAAACMASVPFIGALADAPSTTKLLALAPPLFGYYSAGCVNFAANSAVVNNVVPAAQRGHANGIATTVEAVGKAAGPTVGATLLALGLKTEPGLVGAGAVFWGLAAIMAASLAITRSLPSTVERDIDDEDRAGKSDLELATPGGLDPDHATVAFTPLHTGDAATHEDGV